VKRYRKRPVVIEAAQWAPDERNPLALAHWCGGLLLLSPSPRIIIHTLEGDHEARPGDWVIRGVAGEFYPCKPEIFRDTYEAVD
jgi:hypothetical protein